jgi:hypothetical protein
MTCDADSNIKSRKMPLIQADPYKDNEMDFQKRKTCRTWEVCPEQIGFDVKGFFRSPPDPSFMRDNSGEFENASIVGSDTCSNSV